MSSYRTFVKSKMSELRSANLTPQQKMKRIGEMWSSRSHGGAITGGSLLGDIVPFGHMLGLGMEKRKRGRGRPRKGGSVVAGDLSDPIGAGIFGDIGNAVDGVGHLFGLGLKPKRGSGRPKKSKAHGKGLGDDIWKGFSQGFAMPFKLLGL